MSGVQDPGGPARVLAGRYELGQLLGRGGMAEVYAAYDRRLGRTVAVKVLRPDLADESFRARFQREAKAAASLNHPSIVAVHDTGDETAEPFIVMELVSGQTLREMLPDGQPMPVDQALTIVVGVLDALEYAHRAGIVHRDIKPGNIMLTPAHQVKVMDFGIARALADDVTLTQTVVGTPAYLSPEHAKGEPVDVRSDLYSVGCVLFELLTGRPPFVAESAYAVAVQHIQEPPPVPSAVNPALPPVLDAVVAKALAKDRDARYATAAQMRADLVAVQAGLASGGVREKSTEEIVLGETAVMAPVGPPDGTVALRPHPTAAGQGPAGQTAPPGLGPAGQPVPAGQPYAARPLPSDVPAGQAVPVAAVSGFVPHPGAVAPDPAYGPDGSSGAPVRSRRRRWPLVAAGVVVVLAVGGGVTFAVLRGGSGQDDAGPTTSARPFLVEKIDVGTLSPAPTSADLQDSVKELSTKDTVKVLDTNGTVEVLDTVGTVKPWVQSEDGNVTISSDLLFDFDSAQISEGGKEAILKAVAQVPDGASLDVTGYTDSTGTDDHNNLLSQERADAVKAIIDAARPDIQVNAVGKGSQDPVADNTNADGSDNPDGRAQNRRVEIRNAGS